MTTALATRRVRLTPDQATATRPAAERLRSRRVGRTERLIGWAVTIGLTALAFLMRLPGLGYPRTLVFDETYYPKDAYSLLKYGYEGTWVDGKQANPQIAAGTNIDSLLSPEPSFVVHPPLGKWLIAAGEAVFGMDAFGWRFASLVFGALLVFVTIRLARRVSGSVLVAGITGLLLCLDGLTFVMSRIGLLDIFLAFFLIAAVSCLVADRDWFRDRLADHLIASGIADLARTHGPRLWIRPWRIAAGVFFGLALATKWNALYVLAAFALLSLAWDVGARRVAGSRFTLGRLLSDGIPAFVSLVVISVILYVVSWVGWFATDGGYNRQWGHDNPDARLTKLLGPDLGAWLDYQRQILEFHSGDYIKNATHPYDANPAGWLLMLRPIGIDAVLGIKPGTEGCPADATQDCLRVISGAGTPLLWWAAAVALVGAAIWWLGARDWRFGVVVVGVLSAWLPWFAVADRPEFFFYAITIIPFTAMGLAMCLGKLIGSPHSRWRLPAAVGTGVLIALIAINFAFMYPIYTDQVLTNQQWQARMWLRSWI